MVQTIKSVFLLTAFLFFNGNFAQIKIRKICDVASTLNEISGLIKVNEKFWGMNDGGNLPRLYQIDTSTGLTKDSTTFANVSNEDWEELCTDSKNVYIGEFGNNDGVRKNLKIYYFPISELGKQNVICDTIQFNYSDQKTFSSNVISEFDCEAFCAYNDSLFLFSKSKSSGKCRVYVLPASKGKYIAQVSDSIFVNSWVTGASLYNGKISFCSYVYFGSFFDYFISPIKFKSGRYLDKTPSISAITGIPGPAQIETIMQVSESKFILTSESFGGKPAAIYELSYSPNRAINSKVELKFVAVPNPIEEKLEIQSNKFKLDRVEIYNTKNELVYLKKIEKEGLNNLSIVTSDWSAGGYKIVAYSGKRIGEQWIIKY